MCGHNARSWIGEKRQELAIGKSAHCKNRHSAGIGAVQKQANPKTAAACRKGQRGQKENPVCQAKILGSEAVMSWTTRHEQLNNRKYSFGRRGVNSAAESLTRLLCLNASVDRKPDDIETRMW
jgi:hypothetical protein